MEFSEIRKALGGLSENTENVQLAKQELVKKQWQNYHVVTLIDIVMTAVMSVEEAKEKNYKALFEKDPELLEMHGLIKNCVSNIVEFSSDSAEQVIINSELTKAKEKLKKRLQVLVGYNDALEIYETVYHRLNSQEVQDKEALVDKVMAFVLMDTDQYLLNQRMKDVLRIMPVRMTKSKRDAYVEQALSLYSGCSLFEVEQMLNQLKETVLPERIHGYGDYFDDLYKHLQVAMEIEEPQENHEELFKKVTEDMEHYFDVCSTLVTLINKLMVLCGVYTLNIDELKEIEPKIENAVELLRVLYSKMDTEGALEEKLVALEGVPEQWYMHLYELQGLIDVLIEQTVEDRDFYLELKALEEAKNLISQSLFEDEEEEKDSAQVDAGKLAELSHELNEYMEDLFDHYTLPVARQKFNQLLHALPIVFRTTDQFRAFVAHNIESCSNSQELGYIEHELAVLGANYR